MSITCSLCESRRCPGHTTKGPRPRRTQDQEYWDIEAEMRRRGFRVNQPTRTKVAEENVKAVYRWLRKR